eukprot:5071388-Prymnesium_polylepis.1
MCRRGLPSRDANNRRVAFSLVFSRRFKIVSLGAGRGAKGAPCFASRRMALAVHFLSAFLLLGARPMT